MSVYLVSWAHRQCLRPNTPSWAGLVIPHNERIFQRLEELDRRVLAGIDDRQSRRKRRAGQAK